MARAENGFWVVATAIGEVGILWSDAGVTEVEIGATRRAIGRAPAWVKGVAAKLRAHFAGRAQAFGDVALEWSAVTHFQRRVYEATRKIRCGATSTYGDVARAIGTPHAARAVGQALRKNPFGIVVPCHRVVAAGGKLGGFSAPRGVQLKEKMLAIERGATC
jgi:methylated-DNA-[protein]-cysteine S-methyltransferase